MTTPTLVRQRAPSIRASVLATAALIVGIALVLWIGTRLLQGPHFVEQVRIVNETDYDVNANVSGTDRRVLGLGYVEAGADTTVRSVIDQGDTWIFTFSFGGTRAAKISVSEAELERADWTVEVPTEVEERLDRAGYEPPGR
jgi:hypothetical protein